MENKTLIKLITSAIAGLIFVITFYFFYGMMSNGAPTDYDPGQLGLELVDQKKASASDYLEKGQKLYEEKIGNLDSHILSGVSFMKVILYLGGGLMILFLLYGLFITATSDFKKALPSLIFVVIAAAAFLWAYINSGTDTKGFDSLVAKNSPEDAGAIMSTTNFWVNGLLFVLIPGGILLVVDLIKDIVKGFAK